MGSSPSPSREHSSEKEGISAQEQCSRVQGQGDDNIAQGGKQGYKVEGCVVDLLLFRVFAASPSGKMIYPPPLVMWLCVSLLAEE